MGPTETPKIDLNKSPGPSGMSARSNDMTHTCPKCLGTGNISAFGLIRACPEFSGRKARKRKEVSDG